MPHSARRVSQISPIVQRARSASRIGGSRFSVAARCLADALERGAGLVGVALGAHLRGALELAALGIRVDRLQLDRLLRRRPRTC